MITVGSVVGEAANLSATCSCRIPAQPLLRTSARDLKRRLGTSVRVEKPVFISRPTPCPKRQQRYGITTAATRSYNPSASPEEDGGAHFLKTTLPLALSLALCNMDRIVLSVAIVPIAREFGFSIAAQGLIQSAFLWGYMGTQLLGGTLADRVGGKLVMAWGIALFSLTSLMMPLALSKAVAAAALTFPAVLATRVCIGLGEGVALPSMNNMVAGLPTAKRSTALGIAFTGFHCGNLIGLAISPMILAAYGWRALFLIFGILGGPLLAFWLSVVPDPPPKRPKSIMQPVKEKVTVARLLRSPATWAIIVVNIVNHWGYFIYLNWMPSYFHHVFGLDMKSSSFLSFLPWTVMAIGSMSAGLLADTLVRRGMSVTRVRKAVQTVAFVIPAAALLVLANPGISTTTAVACLTIALGTTSLGQAGFVANMADIAPGNAGQMFGLCNTFGSLSGIVGVSIVGYVVQRTGSFSPIFKMTAVLYVFGTLIWNLFCTGNVVFE
ncbi:g7973 [Coccomyxa elongata]